MRMTPDNRLVLPFCAGLLACFAIGCASDRQPYTWITATSARVTITSYKPIEYIHSLNGREIAGQGFFHGDINEPAIVRFEGGPEIKINDVVEAHGQKFTDTSMYIFPDGQIGQHMGVKWEESPIY